jgi:hypothetical protein
MTGRKLTGITPVYSQRLKQITCLDYAKVKDCYELLWKVHIDSKIQHVRLIPKNTPGTLFRTRVLSQQFMEEKEKMLNQEDEKFDVHEKRKQIEQLKQTIKERLTLLNRQSKNIEILLQKDGVAMNRAYFKTEFMGHSKSSARVLSSTMTNSLLKKNLLNPQMNLKERAAGCKSIQELLNKAPIISSKEKENNGKLVRTNNNLHGVNAEISNLLKQRVRI